MINDDFSPMMKHYNLLKQQYQDCIVFYRLGDFYEMFFEDAIKASEILDLTLTKRSCGKGERAPMCGVPFHSADVYIAKLVNAGLKVAICEQLEKPEDCNNKILKRDVIRVVTAGTITNSDLIDDKKNNFICSVYLSKTKASLAWADITTGEFFAKNLPIDNFANETINSLIKISPVEIIANETAQQVLNSLTLVKQGAVPFAQYFSQSEFQIDNAKNTLLKQFGVLSLSSYNLSDSDGAISSSGALVSYLTQTQKSALLNLKSISLQDEKEFMMLDATAVRNLELVKTMRDGKRYGSLLWVLDKTKTSMGARKLQSWILSPLNDIEKINQRLCGVECIYNDTPMRQNLTDTLRMVKDVGRITGKICNGNLQPRDCIALSYSLESLPAIKMMILGTKSNLLNEISNKIEDFSNLIKLINLSIVDEESDNTDENKFKYIKKGFSAELDELRDLCHNSRYTITQMEAEEREKTGIKNLKINYNRVFGYYIEITNSFKDKVPYHYVRKQTLTNAERYTTDELREVESKILSAEESATRLELELYSRIKTALTEKAGALMQTADAVAELDVLTSFANVAREYSFVKPQLKDYQETLVIEDGRHPVVELSSKQRFVPNDCVLDNYDNRTMIITGPNMAGKSTYMRQVALITLMAHIGCFVPCKKAEIPLVDKIFTRIGASDNLIYDQSTFMVEMSEMAYIINNATQNSLLILDEIGRGTSTFDGLSIAWAVVEHVTNNLKSKTLFATHYHELAQLEGIQQGVKNYKFTVKEFQGSIIFLRKIMRGGANRSFGIEVAELAGINKNLTDRAKVILRKLENSDITKNNNLDYENEEFEDTDIKKYSEIEQIISDLNLNNISPMQAFSILCDLQEKIKG